LITALAGGVGAARLLQGLAQVLPDGEELTVIVNTGDDIELHGLHISPDLDIVMYTLAGLVDEARGWGIRGDSFNALEMLHGYGLETWFSLGDKDLATHIWRTSLLRSGLTLSQATRRVCQALGLKARLLPMTDSRFETKVATDVGLLHFQEYLVKRGARDKVLGVIFDGVDQASPAPGVLDALQTSRFIIVCPSNPVVSIGTILSVPGVREGLGKTEAKIAAISPIIAGAPVKGPADRLMEGLGLEVSAYSVAALYRDFLDLFIMDEKDRDQLERVKALGLQAALADTLMRSIEDKLRLARFTLEHLETP